MGNVFHRRIKFLNLGGKIFVDFNSEGGGKDSEVQNIYRQHGFMCKGTEQE